MPHKTVVSIVEKIRFHIHTVIPHPGGDKRFSLLQNVQTGSTVNLFSYLKGTVVLSWG
jgi:hypothetical protein